MNLETLKQFAIFALSPEDRLAKALASKKSLAASAQISFGEFVKNPLRVYICNNLASILFLMSLQ